MADSYSLQLRVFNSTASPPFETYIALGDENVVAEAWSGPPPSECDYVVGPGPTILSLTPAQLILVREGRLHAAAVVYSGIGGIYFTPGIGQAT